MILSLADVAELADAQVSEACDGDIVEVQVLSSAPDCYKDEASPVISRARFILCDLILEPALTSRVFKNVPDYAWRGASPKHPRSTNTKGVI